MTYAAPRMLHFNQLLYYVIPTLPLDYAAPNWLSIEPGIFASRLYMNFSECAGVKRYLRLFQCRKPTEPQQTCRCLDQGPGKLSSGLATLRRKGHDIITRQ